MVRHEVTVSDIAKRAGISKSTVSRALKDHADINAETKRKIKVLADEMGYSPNLLALSFKKSRSNIIGILVPDIERPFYASLVSGIQQQAGEQNFFTLICQSKDSYITELNMLKTLLELRVSGIVFCHSKETATFNHVAEVTRKQIPLVLIDRPVSHIQTSFVSTDHYVGGYMMGEHLVDQGYKKIAIIAGPRTLDMSNKRIKGCIAAVANADLTMSESRIKYCDFQRERVLSAAMKLLDKRNSPDAFFCIHDRAAITLLEFLEKRGLKVPDEIGVSGFGNEPISAVIHPGLTTVKQHPFKMGEMAAELVLQEIKSEEYTIVQKQVVPPELLVRASTLRKKLILR